MTATAAKKAPAKQQPASSGIPSLPMTVKDADVTREIMHVLRHFHLGNPSVSEKVEKVSSDYLPALLEPYARIFALVAGPGDHPNPYFPFFHLRSEGFWHPQPLPGREAALETMRECEVVGGFAGHDMRAHTWIRDNLQPDFQMCCYYDPSPRGDNPHHVGGHEERWDKERRDEMAAFIPTLPWPAIHYKVFAAGNRSIEEGWQFLASQMRPGDTVCIGHFLKDNPDMIAENAATLRGLLT